MRETKQNVYIVDGTRTPFIKMQGKPNPLSAADLAVAAAGPLLARQPFSPKDIDEVIAGCVGAASDEANIGRIIALRLGCGNFVEGWTVQRNCASGLQALESAAKDIREGLYHLVLAGGTESMSRMPLVYRNTFISWLADLKASKGVFNKLKTASQFRPGMLSPVVALLNGLTDPVVNLNMGQTAENLVYQFNITREELDAYSVMSHQRAVAAMEKGYLDEIMPLYDWQGNVIDFDNGVRKDSSIQKLATLKPAFDKPFGTVTAGNSSQISDGAAFLILASETAVKRYKLPVLGRIIDTAWSAIDPAVMGLGPVHAIHKLMSRQKLTIEDIDYWEINEAFASQMLACLKALQDEEYLSQFNISKPLGAIPLDRLNVDGGAIAIGHPVGASGARLVLHLLQTLKRNNAKRGIASLCIGGGQGGAMLVESLQEIS
jgi:acetyl-CoA C-acetyltransferase